MQQDRTCIGLIHAGEDFDQCGFAGAVLAQQPDNLAGIHLEIHLIQRLDAQEAFRDLLHLNNWSVILWVPTHCGIDAFFSLYRQFGHSCF